MSIGVQNFTFIRDRDIYSNRANCTFAEFQKLSFVSRRCSFCFFARLFPWECHSGPFFLTLQQKMWNGGNWILVERIQWSTFLAKEDKQLAGGRRIGYNCLKMPDPLVTIIYISSNTASYCGLSHHRENKTYVKRISISLPTFKLLLQWNNFFPLSHLTSVTF